MTARAHNAPTLSREAYDDGTGVFGTYEVVPWRKGRLWRLDYSCLCGHVHRHGGGDGERPFMGNGLWTSDCPLQPEWAPLVRLVLPKDWKP